MLQLNMQLNVDDWHLLSRILLNDHRTRWKCGTIWLRGHSYIGVHVQYISACSSRWETSCGWRWVVRCEFLESGRWPGRGRHETKQKETRQEPWRRCGWERAGRQRREWAARGVCPRAGSAGSRGTSRCRRRGTWRTSVAHAHRVTART